MQVSSLNIQFIIALLPSMVALIGVAISLLVLFEMKRQRQQSYKPQLFLRGQHFWLQTNPNGTPCNLNSENSPPKVMSGPSYFIEMKNIGLGAAHTVEVFWRYNVANIADEYRLLADKTGKLKCVEENYFQYLFDPSSDQGYGFVVKAPPEEANSLSYLSAGETYQLRVPETVKDYVTFVTYLKLAQQGFPHRLELRYLNFRVAFRFTDVSGKRHRETLNADIDLYAFGENDRNGNYAVGNFRFGKQETE